MKPYAPYHAVTSLHREAGGLKGLEFLVTRLGKTQEKQDAGIKILIFGKEAQEYALALSVAGYDTYAIIPDESLLNRTDVLAQELGMPVNLSLDGSEWADVEFDACLARKNSFDDAAVWDLPQRMLKTGGRIWLIGEREKSSGYHEALTEVQQNKYRIAASISLQMFGRFYAKRGGVHKSKRMLWFHALDKIDGFLCDFLSTRLAKSWIFELVKSQDKPLIVQVLPTLSASGGAERLALMLAQKLPEYGYEVLLLAIVRGGGLEKLITNYELRITSRKNPEYRTSNVELRTTNSDSRNTNVWFEVIERQGFLGRLRNFIEVRKRMKELRPLIVHTHLFAADFWGRLAARGAGIRNIVTTMHNTGTDFGKMGEFAMRFLKNFSRRYIAVSQAVKEALVDKWKVDENKIAVIVNGIVLGKIVKRGARPFCDVPRLMFAGRLTAQKDPLLLFEALFFIKRPFVLDIFGEGEMLNDCKRAVERLGLKSKVRFLGVREELYDVYHEYDLLCAPSKYEGFGLVLAEAAVAGLAVLASDLPVIRELLGDGACYAPARDAQAWTSEIAKILENPAEIVARAQKLSMKNWDNVSIDKMTDGYAKIYSGMTEGKL